MKVKGLILILLISFMAASTLMAKDKNSRPAYHICKAGERIVFSCKTDGKKGKILSLCATPGFSENSGYLYYRFGIKDNVEMEYPKGEVKARDAFEYERYTRPAQGPGTALTHITLTFKNNEYTYTVSESTTDEGKDGGVKIVTPGKNSKKIELSCMRPVMGNLFDLEDKVSQAK